MRDQQFAIGYFFPLSHSFYMLYESFGFCTFSNQIHIFIYTHDGMGSNNNNKKDGKITEKRIQYKIQQ